MYSRHGQLVRGDHQPTIKERAGETSLDEGETSAIADLLKEKAEKIFLEENRTPTSVELTRHARHIIATVSDVETPTAGDITACMRTLHSTHQSYLTAIGYQI